MASSHPHEELDFSNPGSVSSSPRLHYHYSRQHTTHDLGSQVRLMCSFGGKISPRLHDNRLSYVGGDTRMIAIHRPTTFLTLLSKLSKLSGIMSGNLNVKYQLPYEDLDALISVSNDEDVENMIEEYDRFARNQNPGPVRFRLFLFNKHEQNRRPDDAGSDLHGSANPEQWFLDALEGSKLGYATQLKPSRSEAASFFGLDNNDKTHFSAPKWKTLSKLSESGSQAPDPASSPHVAFSWGLPHVKTGPGNPSTSTEYEKDQRNYFKETGPDQVPHLGGHAPNSHHVESTGQPEQVYQIMNPIHVPYVIPYSSLSGQIPSVGYYQSVPVMGHAYNPITRSTREMDFSNDPDDGLNRGEHLYY